MITLRQFKLPSSDTRLVVFGNTVFKLKYKMSQEPTTAAKSLCKSRHVQGDLEKATAVILSHVLRTGRVIPFKTDNLVIYPATQPWPVGQDLYFSYNDQELRPHPDIILLLVHLKSPPEGNGHSSLLGKHRGPEDELLPAMTGVPSSEVLARKRLRLERDGGDSCSGLLVPSASNAALPTGAQTGRRQPPSKEVIEQDARETKERLLALSQPTQDKDLDNQTSGILGKVKGVLSSVLK